MDISQQSTKQSAQSRRSGVDEGGGGRGSLFKSIILGVIIGAVLTVFSAGIFFTFLSNAVGNETPDRIVIEESGSAKKVLGELRNVGVAEGWFEGVIFSLLAPEPVSLGVYNLDPRSSVFALARGFAEPDEYVLVLGEEMNRSEIGVLIGEAVNWNEQEVKEFLDVYVSTQWRSLNGVVADEMTERYEWSEDIRRFFLTHETKYREADYDILGSVYVPDIYIIEPEQTFADVADMLVERMTNRGSSGLSELVSRNIDEQIAERVNQFVMEETELLPDMAVLPPMDVELSREGGALLLRFNTTYYNSGDGPLELYAGEAAEHSHADDGAAEHSHSGDYERVIYQNIYGTGESVRRKASTGTFLWHDEHLHYHFSDFVDYRLEPLFDNADVVEARDTKASFCVRDISRVDVDVPTAKEEAGYLICGKEIQGVSVGWGDTYFHSFSGQHIDITDLPSGRYRLTFEVNPENLFEEISHDNNEASAVLEIDTDSGVVTIVSTEPENPPAVEHVHIENH